MAWFDDDVALADPPTIAAEPAPAGPPGVVPGFDSPSRPEPSTRSTTSVPSSGVAEPSGARRRFRWEVAAAIAAPIAVFAAAMALLAPPAAQSPFPAIPADITAAVALCTTSQDGRPAVVFGLPNGEYVAGALPGPEQIPSWEIGGQPVTVTAETLAGLPPCSP